MFHQFPLDESSPSRRTRKLEMIRVARNRNQPTITFRNTRCFVGIDLEADQKWNRIPNLKGEAYPYFTRYSGVIEIYGITVCGCRVDYGRDYG